MSKRESNNRRLLARYTKLNAGKTMTLEQFQKGFREFCRAIMK